MTQRQLVLTVYVPLPAPEGGEGQRLHLIYKGPVCGWTEGSSILIFLEAFSTLLRPGPSLEIVAGLQIPVVAVHRTLWPCCSA